MNKRLVTYLIVTVSILLIGCKSTVNGIAKNTSSENKANGQPLVIDIPEASKDGALTVRDQEGNTYFYYAGEINIQNDGKDGNPIGIEVIIPSEEED